MKKSQIFKMLALVTATMAFAACGSTASTSGTADTASTDDTALPGDGTATTDSAAGDTTTGNQCTYTKPTTNPGCTAADDKTWVTLAADTTAISDNFGNIVSDCTLKQGCLAQGDACTTDADKATAKALCITTCILKECQTIPDSDSASAKCAKISNNCAWCYGRYSGECGFEKCLTDCATDSSSAACRDCLKTNCDTVRDACKDGN